MCAIVAVTTVGNEEQANELSRELVSRRLAACVNILPIRRSVYRWQGKVCEDSEFLLLIKTLESAFEAVQTTIQEIHEYDLPEILAFPVGRGESGFLEWISASVDPDGAGDGDDEPRADAADGTGEG